MSWSEGLDIDSAVYKFASDNSDVICVIAGPGTGKSFGLQRHVARLIEQGKDPQRILVVTFTRTAAQDLHKDIHSLGIEGSDKVIAKTLHSFCFSLLNKKGVFGKTQRIPRPLLEFEQNPMLFDLGKTFGGIRKKKKLLKAFETAWARLQSDEPGFPSSEFDKRFEKELKTWLVNHSAMIFGEMIIEAYRYLKNNPNCDVRKQFEYVFVDEYQDLNKAEQSVIEYLVSDSRLVVIGDDDQSIYSFKHAHPEGIRDFPSIHSNCRQIVLNQCRRCPKRVVRMASHLISKNRNRTLGELLEYENNEEGEVNIIQWPSLEDEILGIANRISVAIKNGRTTPEEVLVLVPVKNIGLRIRDELVKLGIQAKSYFRETAIETDELKDSYSMLTLLAKPEDKVALRYLLGSGSKDFRTRSYVKVLEYANENNLTVPEVLIACNEGKLTIRNTAAIVKRYAELSENLSIMRERIINEPDSLADIIVSNNQTNAVFRSILAEAIDEAKKSSQLGFEDWLKDILAHVIEGVSFPENSSELDHVRVMSLHASKGLSANYVIIMSLVDELIPRFSEESDLTREQQLEEQRRLLYVAITRCKSKGPEHPGTLIISSFKGLPGKDACPMRILPYCEWRKTSVSRFIADFDDA